MKFNIICADPPWNFSDQLKMSDVKRGAEANYTTMSLKDIKELPVKEMANPDGAVLALWVPSSLLQDGLDVMKAWGFEQKQTYIWVKTKKEPLKVSIKVLKKYFKTINSWSKTIELESVKKIIENFSINDVTSFFMGRLFRNTHEICLIGINNKNIYKHLTNKSQRTVSFAENLKHSAKPEHLQNSLELMFADVTIKKVELFARRPRVGWFTVGNESALTYGEDIRVSLKKLIKFKGDALKLTPKDWKALDY
jgi:N6-adenosine-specific RNA methylase IME4